MSGSRHRSRRRTRWVPLVLGTGGVLVTVALVWIWARNILTSNAAPARQIAVVVNVIRPPPPPPAPPPPPPPPEEKIPVRAPDPTPDPTPQPELPQSLGVDAAGSAGGDAFGLAARPGGADLVGTGGAIFGRYTSLLKDAILGQLSDDDRIRRGSYSVVVRVWIAGDGQVKRVALAQGSGERDVDTEIEHALSRLTRVSEAPPIEMPQPVTLKIVSRG